jgi:hypothetical protein
MSYFDNDNDNIILPCTTNVSALNTTASNTTASNTTASSTTASSTSASSTSAMFIKNFFDMFKDNNMIGLESINNTILYLVLLNYSKKFQINDSIDNIVDNKKQINEKYNMFRFKTYHNDDDYMYNTIISKIKMMNITYDNINIVNDTFLYYLNNDTQLSIKEYYNYYNNMILSDFIVNMVIKNNNKYEYIYDGNMKINSFISNYISKVKNVDYTKIFGLQNNNNIKDLVNIELFLKTNINFNNNITSNDVLINDLQNNKLYDLIFFDLQINTHNIIHANCCERIKKLKIRGTKAEALLLQLIMLSLNKMGVAVIIVPDSILYGSSTQQCDTRKYLLENFNILNIIEIDESIYYYKGNKSSILYFKNDGNTKNITFSKLTSTNIETIKTINIDMIVNNMYNLYYKSYNSEKTDNNTKTNTNIDNLINIYKSYKEIQNVKNLYIDSQILTLPKYLKNNSMIKTIECKDLENNDNQEYFIVNKNKSSEFTLQYLKKLLTKNSNLYTEGKMNQINISNIKKIEIPNVDPTIQSKVIDTTNIIESIKNKNINIINEYNNIISNVFQFLDTPNKNKLELVCDIYSLDEIKNSKIIINDNIIGITRNGSNAGSVYLISKDKISSNNSYYLIGKDNIIQLYLYYYLFSKQSVLEEKSKLTAQNNLTKTSLETINIHIVNMELQKYIVDLMTSFNNNISKIIETHTILKNIDIDITKFFQ